MQHLYHFTSRDNLRSIMRNGLTLGAVHVSRRQQLNAIWLTTDPGPNGHGLEAGGGFMSDADRQEALEWSGALPPAGARFPKSAEVRITVDIATGDRNLHEWLFWARRQLAPDWMAHLHPVASGNLRKAKTWRLYFGIITPDRFLAVDEVEDVPAPASPEPAPPLVC